MREPFAICYRLIFVAEKPSEQEIVDFYQKLLWSTQVSITTKQYTLVSLAKLSTRLRAGQE